MFGIWQPQTTDTWLNHAGTLIALEAAERRRKGYFQLEAHVTKEKVSASPLRLADWPDGGPRAARAEGRESEDLLNVLMNQNEKESNTVFA